MFCKLTSWLSDWSCKKFFKQLHGWVIPETKLDKTDCKERDWAEAGKGGVLSAKRLAQRPPCRASQTTARASNLWLSHTQSHSENQWN